MGWGGRGEVWEVSGRWVKVEGEVWSCILLMGISDWPMGRVGSWGCLTGSHPNNHNIFIDRHGGKCSNKK